jgi:hypothetical protein
LNWCLVKFSDLRLEERAQPEPADFNRKT